MQVPAEISYHGVDRSDWSEEFIGRQVERLERYAPDMIACRIAVEQPHRRHHQGRPYHVRVEVTLPGHIDLVATAEPVEVPQTVELRTVIRDAFKAMEKQVKKAAEQRRPYDVKTHDQPMAFVSRVFPADDYGFITTPEGREIYFHRNAVLHGDYERLTIGTEVRFAEEMGEEGPQATTVQIVDKPGVREGRHASPGAEVPPDWH